MQYMLSVIFVGLLILCIYGMFTNLVCYIDIFTVHDLKEHGKVELQLHSFLTSTLDEREMSNSQTCHIAPG
jgi:hypothetical protein